MWLACAPTAERSAELTAAAARIDALLATLTALSQPRGEHDHRAAFVTVQAGAGGTEANDFAAMLLRMYVRWAERHGLAVAVLFVQAGDQAGIRSACLRIRGEHVYGRLRHEQGVHRLQRFSPYGDGERQTSFAAVEVTPEFDDVAAIVIPPQDLRIDTFCSSGPGGQHVNKTESAVRLTHLPTGLVVSCQQGRSQHENRAVAFATLQSRLQQRAHDERVAQSQQLGNGRRAIQRGQQIRNYTLQPYQLCKDLRSGIEVRDVQAVLDGAIDALRGDGLGGGESA